LGTKKEKFKELVKEYSEDEATKEKDGSLGAINTNTLSSSYDEILKSARELKDGEYSKSVITTELGYHVIFRESSKEKPSYDSKKNEIKEAIKIALSVNPDLILLDLMLPAINGEEIIEKVK